MYLYNEIKEHPEMDFYPRTFIFGAKAAAGYRTAKLTIKLINAVADVINNDTSINGKIKVVFIENYRVSNAEWIFAAADVSEQISTASVRAPFNMNFMLPVPDASLLAVEICSETSAAAKIHSALDTR